MVEIRLNLPSDLTFLSGIMYEGILFSILSTDCRFDHTAVYLPQDFLCRSYSSLDDGVIDNLRIVMSGNDNINVKLFEKLGLNVKSRKTYYDLIRLLKENSDRLVSKDTIDLEMSIVKKDTLIDLKSKSEGLSAPQLFKVDRYTGISSLEAGYTSQQLTLYASKEATLIGLLGVYSSFVTTFKRTYYYFLFLSPDEVISLLAEGNRRKVEGYLIVKERIAERLREILGKSTITELIMLEVLLSVEVQNLMIEENLDKISLVLFKIAPEGQTYKIYEQIPITIFKKPKFYRVIEKYIGDPQRFCEKLSEALNPNRTLFKALASLNAKNKFSEADNVLKAVQELYRFVVLGDTQGWFGFVRELWNCYSKLANSSDRWERNRSKDYIKIVRDLAYI